MNPLTADIGDAVRRLAELHRLTRALRDAEGEHTLAAEKKREAAEKVKLARAKREAYLEADSKPLPLFDRVLSPPEPEPPSRPAPAPPPNGTTVRGHVETLVSWTAIDVRDGKQLGEVLATTKEAAFTLAIDRYPSVPRTSLSIVRTTDLSGPARGDPATALAGEEPGPEKGVME